MKYRVRYNPNSNRYNIEFYYRFLGWIDCFRANHWETEEAAEEALRKYLNPKEITSQQ